MRTSEFSCQNQLLLLLQTLDSFDRNVECLGDDTRRRQRKPLSEGNVNHTITLVELDPDQSFVGRSVLHVVPSVVGEHCRVACGEVECTSGGLGSNQ